MTRREGIAADAACADAPEKRAHAGGRYLASRALEVVGLALLPASTVCAVIVGADQSGGFMLIASVCSMALMFLSYEWGNPSLRETMPVVVLAALAAAGRIIFAFLPSVQPATAIVIVAGCVFGRRSGFMVGALSGLASSFFLGLGAWTPWQMYAWGIIGWIAGMLGSTRLVEKPGVLYVYGFASGLLYGLVLNLWSIIGFYHPETFVQLVAIFATAIPFDVVHGASTVAFLLLIWIPWRRKLTRLKRAYGFGVRDDAEGGNPSCAR